MEEKYYEFILTDSISVNKEQLFRIRALKNISFFIKKGNIGGYVGENARVSGNAWVSGDAQVYGNAWVSGDAQVYGNAWVSGDARVLKGLIKKTNDYIAIACLGSRGATLTAYFDADGFLNYTTGCFSGREEDFIHKVKETHGDNNFAQLYMESIKFVKIFFRKQ